MKILAAIFPRWFLINGAELLRRFDPPNSGIVMRADDIGTKTNALGSSCPQEEIVMDISSLIAAHVRNDAKPAWSADEIWAPTLPSVFRPANWIAVAGMVIEQARKRKIAPAVPAG